MMTAIDRHRAIAVHRAWDSLPGSHQSPYQDLVSAVDAVAGAQPDRSAIEEAQTTLTYRELVEQSRSVAAALVDLGVVSGDRVVVHLERTLDTVVQVLGLLRAGAIYVPTEISHPMQRIEKIVETVSPRVILSDAMPNGKVGEALVCRRIPRTRVGPLPTFSSPVPEAAAYIMFTSGSTGEPKGAIVSHAGVTNTMYQLGRIFGLGPGSRQSQFGSLAFDMSISEIFRVLCAGATLCMGNKDQLAPGRPFLQFLRDQQITVVSMPPALARRLEPSDLPHLETLVQGGERCTIDIVRRWSSTCRVVNVYGPAECSIVASSYICDPQAETDPPIGYPLPNTEIEIVDEYGDRLPVGVEGELWISGIGIGLGYWGAPELTADAYRDRLDGRRWYRTGDRASRRDDGSIDFHGRVDEQVKIRGVRVEVGEVLAQLRSLDGVADAAVVIDPEVPQLEAFYVGELAPSEVRALLHERLPAPMVPQRLVPIDRIPLNASGKLDRGQLPVAPAADESVVEFDSEVERELATLWAEVFDTDVVTAESDFYDLGGDSLSAVQLAEAIEDRLDLRVEVDALFDYPTLRELARHLQSETP